MSKETKSDEQQSQEPHVDSHAVEASLIVNTVVLLAIGAVFMPDADVSWMIKLAVTFFVISGVYIFGLFTFAVEQIHNRGGLLTPVDHTTSKRQNKLRREIIALVCLGLTAVGIVLMIWPVLAELFSAISE